MARICLLVYYHPEVGQSCVRVYDRIYESVLAMASPGN